MLDSTTDRQIDSGFGSLLFRLMRRAEVFVLGRYWLLEVCFLAMLFSALFTGGIDECLYDMRVKYPAGYHMKIAHPLADVSKVFPAVEHDAKLNFRLTVPVVLHLLRVQAAQWWVLPGLTVCATCGILALCCVFAFRVTGDRVCGLFTTLGVAATYIGSLGTTRYYDAIAICQLLGAMLPGLHWSVRGVLVFSAAFTDERAFLASGLLLAHFICSPGQDSMSAIKRVTRPAFLAVAGGMAGYCIGRVLLARYAGLSTPMADVGLEVFEKNARYWHSGAWFALEGGWLLVGLGMLVLWQRAQQLAFWVFACAIGASICGGLMVKDIVRSTSYALPAALAALAVISRVETTSRIRTCCFAAFAISVVAGDFWVFPNPWYSPPLVVKWLSHALQVILPAG
jgi:hypothetical protein